MVDVIRATYEDSGYLLDPHTAIGLAAARECSNNKSTPRITLATAHPAKFPDAVTKATDEHPELPAHLSDLHDREERFDVLRNDLTQVQHFIRKHVTA